jgi:hypothetical protein
MLGSIITIVVAKVIRSILAITTTWRIVLLSFLCVDLETPPWVWSSLASNVCSSFVSLTYSFLFKFIGELGENQMLTFDKFSTRYILLLEEQWHESK